MTAAEYYDGPVPPPSWGARASLAEAVAAARAYQDLPDPLPLVAAMGAAATARGEGEPCWLLLVAPPSSGKTETVRALDGVADDRLDDVTAAGLLGYRGGKNPKPTGVLHRLGNDCRALVTIGDLSSLLASSDRGGRDMTFALLRRVYDGEAARDLGGAPEPLRWQGRVTVIGAVTGAIDNYAAHNDALGPRWLFCRIPERTTAQRRAASRMARRPGLAQHRARLAGAATDVVTGAASNTGAAIPDDLADVIEDAALVTCWGRASVPRNGYGRREIEGVPVIEEPMRLVQQLRTLVAGVLAIGASLEDAETVAYRVALDSMPETRRRVLDVLSAGEPLTTAALARAARLDRKVARLALEELELIGVCQADRRGDEPGEDEPDKRPATWTLTPGDGDLVAEVFRNRAMTARRWDEMWGPTPHPPEKGEGEDHNHGDGTHVSSHLPPQVSVTRRHTQGVRDAG